MYKVSITRENWEYDGNTHNRKEDTVKDYTGCVQLRISDTGVVSADFFDGRSEVYKMFEGDSLTRVPLTDEEILAMEGLGEWYSEQKALHKEKVALEAGAGSATDTLQ